MQPDEARDVLAQFLLDVNRTGAAYGLCCHGDICAVFGPGMRCLPLWSSQRVARAMQRLCWPNLRVTRIALDEIPDDCVPVARERGTPFGIGVATHIETVAVPAGLVERGLNLALEMKRERTAK
jgi:hypothetical protein